MNKIGEENMIFKIFCWLLIVFDLVIGSICIGNYFAFGSLTSLLNGIGNIIAFAILLGSTIRYCERC